MVAVETSGPATAVARVLERYAGRVVVIDPRGLVRAGARAKTVRLDARTLARLLAAGVLTEIWTPDEATRALRRLVARRAAVVRARTRLKNEVHAVLARNLCPRPPVSDAFGKAGRRWLEALELPEEEQLTGETVLVVGASGGVGSFFVQLAAAAGANVIAPVFAEGHDYLRGLGVSELIDRNADVSAAVRETHPDGVEAILDLALPAPDTSLLKDGGRLASPLGAAGEGPGRFNIMAEPTPANLQRLAELLDDGALRVPIQRSYQLEQADEALQALPTIHTRGKISLTIA